jgi:membrane-bound inhibitor of C-type lysozyme
VNVQHVRHAVAGLCLCMAGAVHAETIHARFDCDGGKSIEAAFDNGPKPSVELALSDGRRWVLPQALSASGARYANGDESIVFWNKGNTAFIEEGGRTTYRDCVAKR